MCTAFEKSGLKHERQLLEQTEYIVLPHGYYRIGYADITGLGGPDWSGPLKIQAQILFLGGV